MELSFIGEFTLGRADQDGADGRRQLTQGDEADEAAGGAYPGMLPFPGGKGGSGQPITLENGEPYGTFCCFTHNLNAAAGADGLDKMYVFAKNAPADLAALMRERAWRAARVAWIEQIIAAKAFTMGFQPVLRLWRNEVVGLDCVPEFPEGAAVDAGLANLGQKLEAAAITQALGWLWQVPAGIDLWISASPGLVMSGTLAALLQGHDLRRIVLQVAEHEPVRDYDAFLAVLIPLRRLGMRLAVDDAGAGHASLRHVLKLRPDVIKLDASLVRNVERDAYKSALTSSLVRFALETGVVVVAKGIESLAEMNVLRDFGAHAGQGNYLGRASGMEAALAAAWQADAAE